MLLVHPYNEKTEKGRLFHYWYNRGMNFDVIGLHPDNALKIALSVFDAPTSVDEKVKTLLSNRPVKNLNSIDLPRNFASGKTIDLNASELLGVGIVADYYMWASQEAGTGNTYQAVVGVEDAAKSQIENVLSDGAVWHDQARKKILAQQVMVQGYFPKKTVTNSDIVAAVEKKMEQRDSYPENCILIVNVFSEIAVIDRETIYQDIKDLVNPFTNVYVVIYNLPLLTLASVSLVSESGVRGLTVDLQRHKYEDEWHFNMDGKRYPR